MWHAYIISMYICMYVACYIRTYIHAYIHRHAYTCVHMHNSVCIHAVSFKVIRTRAGIGYCLDYSPSRPHSQCLFPTLVHTRSLWILARRLGMGLAAARTLQAVTSLMRNAGSRSLMGQRRANWWCVIAGKSVIWSLHVPWARIANRGHNIGIDRAIKMT